MKHKMMVILSMAILTLMITSVGAQPDGLASSQDGALFVKGVVTKDITNPNAIFQGRYGTSSTFTLGDNSTGLGPFNLQNGEIANYGITSGFGNITANPAEIKHSLYNSSGLITPSKWTTGGISMTKDTAGSVANAPNSIRIYTNSVHGSSLHTFTSPISMSKFLNFGMLINTNTLNVSYALAVIFSDIAGNTFQIRLVDSGVPWSPYIAGHLMMFGDSAGDVLFISIKLSDLNAEISTTTLSSITSVKIEPDPAGTPITGVLSADIFALDFTDAPLRFGYDRADQLTSADDYVPLNVTNPSSPDLKVRALDSHISYVTNADIDFITEVTGKQSTYDQVNYRVTDEYEFRFALNSAWSSQVTLSGVTAYHVLDRDYSKYISYSYQDADSQSLILNEVAGDVITLGSVLADTTYRLRYQVQLTESEYDALLANVTPSLWSTDTLVYAFWSVLAFLVPVKMLKNKKNTTQRRRKTKAANRR